MSSKTECSTGVPRNNSSRWDRQGSWGRAVSQGKASRASAAPMLSLAGVGPSSRRGVRRGMDARRTVGADGGSGVRLPWGEMERHCPGEGGRFWGEGWLPEAVDEAVRMVGGEGSGQGIAASAGTTRGRQNGVGSWQRGRGGWR